MNLYDYHKNPETLRKHKDREDIVPSLIKARILKQLPINKKQLLVVKSNPQLALEYAINVIKDRWPEGEDIIATDPQVLTWYESFLSELHYNDSLEDGEYTPRRYRKRIY